MFSLKEMGRTKIMLWRIAWTWNCLKLDTTQSTQTVLLVLTQCFNNWSQPWLWPSADRPPPLPTPTHHTSARCLDATTAASNACSDVHYKNRNSCTQSCIFTLFFTFLVPAWLCWTWRLGQLVGPSPHWLAGWKRTKLVTYLPSPQELPAIPTPHYCR